MRPKQLYRVLLLLICFFATNRVAEAIPTQYGDTGLISQPSAETLNSGNICLGLWGNCSGSDAGTSTVLPVAITLGLGSFLETYGSYPNLLFNDDEGNSGRGFANIGLKLRVIGKRSSPFKLAFDGQLRRVVSDDINEDGLTDKVGRLVVSYKPSAFGIHANAGYIKPESPEFTTYENQFSYGGGVEYFTSTRLRLLAEFGIESAKQDGLADQSEVTVGFQYFFSPHLTLNMAIGKGLSDVSPDWRTLVGLSSCQGVGTYQRPIPRLIQPQADQPAEQKIETKSIKVKTLTPLIPKVRAAEVSPTINKFEVPVGDTAEEIIVAPAVAANLPDVSTNSIVSSPSADSSAMAGATAADVSAMAMTTGAPLLQIAPQVAGAASATALALPSSPSLPVPAWKTGRSYKVNDPIQDENGQEVGKKVQDDPRYAAQFVSISETSTHFTAKFFHRYDKPLDVWIESADNTKHSLSKAKAAAFEEVTLSVEKIKGKVPYFKLHLGEHSEIFEFFSNSKAVKIGKVDIVVAPVQTATKLASMTVDPIPKSSGLKSIPETGGPVKPGLPVAGAMMVMSPAASSISAAAPTTTTFAYDSAGNLTSTTVITAQASTSAPAASAISAAAPTAAAPMNAPVATASTVAAPTSGTSAPVKGIVSAPVAGTIATVSGATVPTAGSISPAAPLAMVPASTTVAAPATVTAPTTGTVSTVKTSTVAPSAIAPVNAPVATASTVAAPTSGTAAPVKGIISAPVAGTIATVSGATVPKAASISTAAPLAMAPASTAVAAPAAVTAPTTGTVSTVKTNIVAPTVSAISAAAPSAVAPVNAPVATASTVAAPMSGTAAPVKASASVPVAGTIATVSGATVPTAGSISTAAPLAMAPSTTAVAAPAAVTAPTAGTVTTAKVSTAAPLSSAISAAAPTAAAPVIAPVATVSTVAAPTSGIVATAKPSVAPVAGTTVARAGAVAPAAGSISTAAPLAMAPATTTVAAPAVVTAPTAGTVTTAETSTAAPTASAPVIAPVATTPSVTTPKSGTAVPVKGIVSAPVAGTIATASGATVPTAGSISTAAPLAMAPSTTAVAATGTVMAPTAGTVTTAKVSSAAPLSSAISTTTPTASAPEIAPVATASTVAAPTSGIAAPVKGIVSAPVAGTTVARAGAVAPAAGSISTAAPLAMASATTAVAATGTVTAPTAGTVTTAETSTAAPVAGKALTGPVKAVVYRKFRLPSTVTFAFDDSTLTEEGKKAITEVVDAIRTEKHWFVIRVDGFTDNVGSDNYNLKLALKRAIAVASYMVTNNGIDPSIVFVKSSGEADPIAINDTEEGRSLNRRAEILLFIPKD